MYDVFLSYNWRDYEAVETIARELRERGLTVFLDRWYLMPGRPWPQALEEALDSCKAVATVLGPHGMGPWQLREKDLALERQARDSDFAVIPVLMPGADPALGFLSLNTWVDLRTGPDDPVSISALTAAVKGEPPGPDLQERLRETLASVCPYRGLHPFREEDAAFFFGRETSTERLLQAVDRHTLVALFGASGSGKSSVARAGLVPHIRRGHGGQVWEVVTLLPGDRPLHALATSLIPLLEPELTEADRLAEIGKLADHFAEKRVALRDVVSRALEKQPGTDRLLLVADQWEELYTICHDERSRARLVDELLEATAHGTLAVVLTMRGDFFGHALKHRALADRLQDGVVTLGPMNGEELERTIVKPAEKVQLSFEHGLVNRILGDVEAEPGSLPLLEFVLTTLWERRRGGQLIHGAYEEIGGLQGAIAGRADEAFDRLTAKDQQAARRVFLQLVRAGEGTEDTRRRMAVAEVNESTLPLLRELANARLVVTGRDGATGQETVEVAHEALIRSWSRLRGWLDEDREFLLWRQRLWAALEEWTRARRDSGALLRGTSLSEAERWLATRERDLSQVDREYVQASLELRDREAAEREAQRQQELDQARSLAEAEKRRAEAQRERAEMQLRVNKWLRGIISALAVSVVAMLASGVWYYDGYVREHVTHFKSFSKRWGSPVGLGELTESQVRGRKASVKLILTGRYRPVHRIQAVNNRGECTSDHDIKTYRSQVTSESSSARECEWEFVGDDDGRVIYEKIYDKHGKLLWGFVYSPRVEGQPNRAHFVGPDGSPTPPRHAAAQFIEFDYSEHGDEVSVRYFDQAGVAQSGGDLAYGKLREFDERGFMVKETSLGSDGEPIIDDSGSATVTLKYDKHGNEIERAYFDTAGKPTLSKDTYHRVVAKYDERGNQTEWAVFDMEGNPVLTKNGYHIGDSSYDERGNQTEWAAFDTARKPTVDERDGTHKQLVRYDDRGNWIEITVFDTAGKPTQDRDGVHRRTGRYDESGNRTEWAYFDTAGDPTEIEEGYHRATGRYDEHDNRLEWAFFDEAGKPDLVNEGYHRILAEYDARGNPTELTYFGAMDEPVLTKSGYHRVSRKYDQRSNLTESTFFDIEGNPTLRRNGYHRQTSKYDVRGRQIEVAHYDRAGQPVIIKDGYCLSTGKYDRRGNRIEWAYFDKSGVPTTLDDGYHRETGKYDDRGNRIEWAYYDKLRAPVSHKKGHHLEVARYDDRGKKIEWSYFSKGGAPTIIEDGYHRGTATYNDRGNQIEMAVFDITGKPTQDKRGVHRTTGRYDESGNRTEWAYFDSAGEPKVNEKGYHRATGRYDEHDNRVEWAFFDVAGAPMPVAGGYHRATSSYDERGNQIEWNYYDTVGNPVLFNSEYHRATGKYDARNHRTEWAYFDAAGNPTLVTDGYHRSTSRYDNRGNETEWSFYDAAGNPVLSKYRYQRAVAKYDDRDNQVELVYFGVKGEPVLVKGGYHRVTGKYDERGNQIEWAFVDTAGKPVLIDQGYHLQTGKYDERGKRIEWAYFGATGEPVLIDDGSVKGGYHLAAAQYVETRTKPYMIYYGKMGEVLQSDDAYRALSRMLKNRPAANRFREQLFWLVDLIYATKATRNPVLVREANLVEESLGRLSAYLETGDQAALKNATRAVERFARMVRRAVAEYEKEN